MKGEMSLRHDGYPSELHGAGRYEDKETEQAGIVDERSNGE